MSFANSYAQRWAPFPRKIPYPWLLQPFQIRHSPDRIVLLLIVSATLLFRLFIGGSSGCPFNSRQ